MQKSAGPQRGPSGCGVWWREEVKSLRMWAPLASKVTFCDITQAYFPSWVPQGLNLKIREKHIKINTPRKHKNAPKVPPKPPKSDPNNTK